MKNSTLLRIELIKFLQKQNLMILLLIPVAATLLARIQLMELEPGGPGAAAGPAADARKAFANAFTLTGLHYVAFSVIAGTGREFVAGIVRKSVIDGYTRKDFILARLWSVAIHVLLTACLGGAGLLAFLLAAGVPTVTPGSLLSGTLSFTTIFFAYGVLALFIVILLRDPVKSLLVFAAYRIFEKLLATLDEQHWYLGYTAYLPTQAIDRMIEWSTVPFLTIVFIFLYLFTALYFTFLSMSKREL